MSSEAKILVGFGLATLIIVIGGLIIFGSGSPTASGGQLIGPDSFQTGPSGAKVTVVEFADFQCPACAAAAPVVTKLEKEYAGQVNFVFRHFPLPAHANAQTASEVGEAAGEQGKFWEMYQLLYLHQTEWKDSGSVDIFVGYAEDLALDQIKFKNAVENYKFIDKVRRDQKDGQYLGVISTPTFFVNGQKYVGAMGYPQFKGIIDQALAH